MSPNIRCLAAAVAALALGAPALLGAEQVGLIKIDGAIGPATATYIARAMDQAAAEHDQCLVIQLDTPGGLLDSTRQIVEKLFTDVVPTVVYVTPSGACAASAGTFITLAADIAAMAPDTSIGAAHPVSLLGGAGEDEPTNGVMREKLENYGSSFIENIANKRNHNIAWAKSAVRESASITADEALQLKVIDLIARDLPDLLQQINGRESAGKTLRTAGARVVEIPMSAREKVFQMLWRPEVMYLLMLVAMYGIIAELSHPGAIFPGVVGAIAVVLSLYMSAVLPINVAGGVLILVAMGLFVADIYAPTHGVLTVGGLAAFFIGSLMLFDRDPAYSLSPALIFPATVLTGLFFLVVIGAGLRAQRLPVKAGPETLIGQTTAALTAIDERGGQVFVDGALWSAVSHAPIAQGQRAEIVGRDRLVLYVKPKS
ncbi:MAG: nodulation protein NfeD [Verrucomicrobiota bacterium]|jgi:membrane-bound serine protease (ClpP class)